MQPGTLFYVVEASGVGKDALINGAIRLLKGRSDTSWPAALSRGRPGTVRITNRSTTPSSTRDLQKELFFTLGPRTAFVTDCRPHKPQ
jgi:hypothetical protein